MNDTVTTICGNLVDAPELRYTTGRLAVASFRVASTPRYLNRQGDWQDGDTLFLGCIVWGNLAENAAWSLVKGSQVVVTGRLRQRGYETDGGERRTVYELQADDVGASLRAATVTITKKG